MGFKQQAATEEVEEAAEMAAQASSPVVRTFNKILSEGI
jgi:hypothetical protein